MSATASPLLSSSPRSVDSPIIFEHAPSSPPPFSCCRTSSITSIALAIIVGGGAITLGTLWFFNFQFIAPIGQIGAYSLIGGGSLLTIALIIIASTQISKNNPRRMALRPPPIVVNYPPPTIVAPPPTIVALPPTIVAPPPPCAPPPTPLDLFKKLLQDKIYSYYNWNYRGDVEVNTYATTFDKFLQNTPDFAERYVTYPEKLDASLNEFFCYQTPRADRFFLIGKYQFPNGDIIDWAMTSTSPFYLNSMKENLVIFANFHQVNMASLKSRPD